MTIVEVDELSRHLRLGFHRPRFEASAMSSMVFGIEVILVAHELRHGQHAVRSVPTEGWMDRAVANPS